MNAVSISLLSALRVGLNVFYFTYFVYASIYLHEHYMSKAIMQKGFERKLFSLCEFVSLSS